MTIALPRRPFLAGLLTLPAFTRARAADSEIRVGFTQDALTLDPANPGNRDTETIVRNMYDGLLVRDPAMKVVPQIAVSWIQSDALTYDFSLRDGVHFHDGTLLTAEDVKFTIDRVLTRQDRRPDQPPARPPRPDGACRHHRSTRGAPRAEQTLAPAACHAAVPGDRIQSLR